MSIRSEAMPYRGRLSGNLQDVLRRNGMQAQLAVEGDKYKLIVQGHDSPLLTYNISEKQFRALADGGTNYANKKAYSMFNSIVSKDFDMPSSYVAARNANGRVVMGLHGVRESLPYGGRGNHHILGWTPRQQTGYHMRRINDVPMVATPMLMQHTDGRNRPGELKSGGYGYYYKGQQEQQIPQKQVDPLKDMQACFPQAVNRPRSADPAKPYKELITSDVYFTNEKWQEVLSSHGIVVDADKKTLTIQSQSAQQDFVYDLKPEEVRKLTDNSLKTTSLQARIDILNNVIGGDFQDKITKEMLNSTERIGIHLKPEIEQSLNHSIQQEQFQVTNIDQSEITTIHQSPTLDPEKGFVDGARIEDYDDRKGWYREGKHGRSVDVGDIWVEKEPKISDHKDGKEAKEESKESYTYKMSAVINGEVITHEISKKQYDRFIAVDDYQRQRMMSKIFDEVDMKTRPDARQRFNIGAFLSAGLQAAREATYIGADISHNVEHIRHPHGGPPIHDEVHGTGRIYVKPGVDSPQDIASRAFEAGLNQGIHAQGLGR